MAELTPGERLALLKAKHGSLEKVQQEHLYTTFLVYDNEGDIHYKGHTKPSDMRKYKGKKLVEMSYSFELFVINKIITCRTS